MNTKNTIKILGHTVEYQLLRGEIDREYLILQIGNGRKDGIIYELDTTDKRIPIGSWGIVDPWKEIAGKLYEELKESGNYSGEGCWGSASDNYEEVITQYEQLIQKENDNRTKIKE